MLVDFDFAKTIKDINDSESGVDDRSPSTSSDTDIRVPNINTEPATTRSDINLIWTVSGLVIHPYIQSILLYSQGTPPFIAIDALIHFTKRSTHDPESKVFTQLPCHDLKSILYIILYICTFFKRPGLMKESGDFPELMSIPLEHWFRQETILAIGQEKVGAIMTAEVSLLAKFTPYWADMVPFVRQLISTCFSALPSLASNLTHDAVLEILKEAYDTVKEPQPIKHEYLETATGRPLKLVKSSHSSSNQEVKRCKV
jgi:hypothetical protein